MQEEGKMKEEVLLKQYQELNERYQEALKKLDKHIDFFARIDLSEITTKEQQILKMIEEGKMDEAVKAYADLGLVKKLSAEVGSLEVMKEEEQRIYDEQARSKAVIDETYNVMQRWAATLTLQGQEEESEAVLDSLLDIISPLYKLVPEEYGPKVAHLHYLLGNYALKDILDDRYDEAKEHFKPNHWSFDKMMLCCYEQHPDTELSFFYVGDNTEKDFVAPNELGWTSVCLLDDGQNIHEQVFNVENIKLPKKSISNISELIDII